MNSARLFSVESKRSIAAVLYNSANDKKEKGLPAGGPIFCLNRYGISRLEPRVERLSSVIWACCASRNGKR